MFYYKCSNLNLLILKKLWLLEWSRVTKILYGKKLSYTKVIHSTYFLVLLNNYMELFHQIDNNSKQKAKKNKSKLTVQ